MKNLLKILIPVFGLSFGGLDYINAQTQDTIFSSKTSSVIEEKYNRDKTILEKKEYIVETTSQVIGDKIILEAETKYLFKEKYLGKPVDPKEPKNILNRKQIDKLLDYALITAYEYDSLGRLTETEKTENYSPGVKDAKKSKTHYTYEGENKNPVKIWDDLNNDGKFNQGDKIRVYIRELDKWVSQEN